MRRRRVVGLGLCVVDHLYRVERIDLAETRTRFHERVVACGGMTATAAVQAAVLGCRTQVLTMVGSDPDGRFVRRSLRAAGVDTRRMCMSPEHPTTVAVVLVARRGGERRFLVPDRRALERAAPDFELGAVDAGTVLMVDGHFPEQALRAVRRARARGATVVADLASPVRSALALLPFVDFPVLPLEFLEGFEESDPRRAIRLLHDRHGGTPVVTQGARGGLYLADGRVRRFRAHPARVVDTTGAGDAFHGAFAAGLCRGLPLADALDLASRAGALACTALGGAGRRMTRSEARSWGF